MPNPNVERWRQQLAEYAWRRTPGRRALDLMHAKVLRYLIARYAHHPSVAAPLDRRPQTTSRFPATATSKWRPRSTASLRKQLDTIRTANEPSYREYRVLRQAYRS